MSLYLLKGARNSLALYGPADRQLMSNCNIFHGKYLTLVVWIFSALVAYQYFQSELYFGCSATSAVSNSIKFVYFSHTLTSAGLFLTHVD